MIDWNVYWNNVMLASQNYSLSRRKSIAHFSIVWKEALKKKN